MCLLLDLATWHVTSGAVLRGRGNLPKLVLLGGIVCVSPRCLHVLWESWSPLGRFWCYWGWSTWQRALIRCEHVIRLLLNIPAEFQGNWSRQRWCVVVGVWGWVGGEVGVHASLLWRSSGLSLHCIRLLALSPHCVHIHMCCHTCGTSMYQGLHYWISLQSQITCQTCPSLTLVNHLQSRR